MLPAIEFNPSEEFGTLNWVSATQTFVAEISELNHKGIALPYPYHAKTKFQIKVVNVETKATIVFEFYKTDYYGSGDEREVSGWRYKAVSGHKKNCELLIIND